MPLGLPPLLPGFNAAGPSAEFMRRRTMGQSARNAMGVATAAGGGLAGARAGAEQAMQGGLQAGFQASELAAQEAQAEAARRQQYADSQSGLSRGLLSGLGGALGATQGKDASFGSSLMGLAGAAAPLLLASDERLKRNLRGANSGDIEAMRQLLLQRQRARTGQAPGMGDARVADRAADVEARELPERATEGQRMGLAEGARLRSASDQVAQMARRNAERGVPTRISAPQLGLEGRVGPRPARPDVARLREMARRMVSGAGGGLGGAAVRGADRVFGGR